MNLPDLHEAAPHPWEGFAEALALVEKAIALLTESRDCYAANDEISKADECDWVAALLRTAIGPTLK